jgi:hypothetical protein
MIVHGTLSIQRLVIHTHTYVHAGKCMLTNASKFEREREREKERRNFAMESACMKAIKGLCLGQIPERNNLKECETME